MRLARSRLWPLLVVGAFLTPVLAAFGLAELLAKLSTPPPRAVSAPRAPAHPRRHEPAPDPLKALSIRIRNREIEEVAGLLETLRGARGKVSADASMRTISVVDRPGEIDRMALIVRELDESRGRDLKIWTFGGMSDPEGIARTLTELFMGADEPGVKISKIIPAEREALLIVVANEAGYSRIWRARPYGCPDRDTHRIRAIRVKNGDLHEIARLLGHVKSAEGEVVADEAWGGLRIRDLPNKVSGMVYIVEALDEYAASGEKGRFFQVRGFLADELMQMLGRAVAPVSGRHSVNGLDPACRVHADGSIGGRFRAVGPNDDKELFVVADDAGYAEITRLIVNGCFEYPSGRTSPASGLPSP